MNGSLMDTNVVSELRKGHKADKAVLQWLEDQPDDQLFLSVATIGEIRMGIERLRARDAFQASILEKWLIALVAQYRRRTFEVTLPVFEKWGVLQAIRPISPIDGLLAATALHHNLTLVTRNTDDFSGLGIQLLNPFTGEKS